MWRGKAALSGPAFARECEVRSAHVDGESPERPADALYAARDSLELTYDADVTDGRAVSQVCTQWY